jgi:hypothetical protein
VRSGKKMNNGQYVILLLYVDDILVMSKMKEDRYWVKEILQQEYEKITMDEGERLPYLGMTILKTKEGFKITMKTYIKDVLQLYGKDIKTCVTLAKPTLFEVTRGQQRVDGVVFHSVVAKPLYLFKRGRPDILLPVQFLCTRVKHPTTEDRRKLERVLGYLRLTKGWSRVFDLSSFNQVMSFIDASFATHEDGKGQSGCILFWGNTLVHEACRKQRRVTKNSTEAELVALSDYIDEGTLLEDFIMELGTLFDEDIVDTPQVVFQDNKSTIELVEKGGGKPRTKYMKVRRAYVTERLSTGEVSIRYTHTSRMVADVLIIEL